jgi:hypothetical protein
VFGYLLKLGCVLSNNLKIENSGLLTSYSVPPQTWFSSDPCSVLIQRHSDKSVIRRTYVVTTDTSTSASALLCFEERSSVSEGSTVQKLSKNISSQSPIVFTETIRQSLSVSSDKSSYLVIALRENGSVECFSDDLKELCWTGNIFSEQDTSETSSDLDIQYAIVMDASAVKSGFLKNRQDVVAQLEGLVAGDEKSLSRVNILCVVSRARGGTDLQLSLKAIRPTGTSTFDLNSNIQDLVTWPLPEHPDGVATRLDIECCFNIKMGFLHVGTSDVIATYDFTGNHPELSSVIFDNMSSLSSQIALSGPTLLAASRLGYTVYDVKYNSIQDRRDTYANSAGAGRKRKRDTENEGSASIRLIDYFSKLGVILALRGRDLSIVQLAQTTIQRQKHESCLLIDALGKGVDAPYPTEPVDIDPEWEKMLGRPLPDSSISQSQLSWSVIMGELEDLASQGDADAFDRLFAKEVNVSYNDDVRKSDDSVEISIYEDTPEQSSVRWKFPDFHGSNKTGVYRTKAIFALRLIFQWQDKTVLSNETSNSNRSHSRLTIQFFPPNVFHWLVITGQLSKDNIQQAFRLYPGEAEGSCTVSHTDLIDALVQFDPSLKPLFSVIKHHLHLEVLELVQAIKHIIRSLGDLEEPLPLPAITNGEETTTIDDGEDHLIKEADNAVDDVDFAISTLEHGIPMRGEALRTALTQLNSFPMSSIVDAFRTCLSQQEVVRLINILRLELEDSGWISRYIDPDPTSADYGIPSNHAIIIISRILGCAVDAIGLNGWVSTFSHDSTDSMDDLLVALRAETSIALEGIHEATFMIGLLNQFMEYARRKRKASRPRNLGPVQVNKAPERELPLGLKIPGEISTTIGNANGKEVKRSIRDIGRQISMQVPKYSFERIVLSKVKNSS